MECNVCNEVLCEECKGTGLIGQEVLCSACEGSGGHDSDAHKAEE